MPRHPAPKFTKQHYEAVAAIFAEYDPHERLFVSTMRELFVELFDDDNARFDPWKFREACTPIVKEDNA